ncbi:hypothetical protein ES708_31186 [subsurface metagenome]
MDPVKVITQSSWVRSKLHSKVPGIAIYKGVGFSQEKSFRPVLAIIINANQEFLSFFKCKSGTNILRQKDGVLNSGSIFKRIFDHSSSGTEQNIFFIDVVFSINNTLFIENSTNCKFKIVLDKSSILDAKVKIEITNYSFLGNPGVKYTRSNL